MARMSRRAFLSPLRRHGPGRLGRGPALGLREARRHRGRPRRRRPPAGQPREPDHLAGPADAGRIADGMAPSRAPPCASTTGASTSTRRSFRYKKVVQDFEKKYKKYDVKAQVSTYGNMDEAVAKLWAGQVAFDVLFPTYDYLGKLIQGNFPRPLNHSYISNIEQVWPTFQNPWYDQGWNYSVPYTIYTTGIAWRVDKVKDDIAKLANPYEALWDEQYRGKVGILDDYREAIGMTLLKNGITDLNTANQDHLNLARDQLVALAKAVRPRVNTNDYIDLPEGKTWITQAWSGDMVNAQYYMPKGQSADVMRYWFPPDGRGPGQQRPDRAAAQRQEPGAGPPVPRPPARLRRGRGEHGLERLPAAPEQAEPDRAGEPGAAAQEPGDRHRAARLIRLRLP